MRLLTLAIGMLATLPSLHASTLERLSLDDMIAKSTEIVRGRILDSHAAVRGPVVYTVVRVEVLERWKGPSVGQVEVAIPGGVYEGIRQTYAGAPTLEPGTDYVLFLWTGKSGITQVIGLSQGVFTVTVADSGLLRVERPAAQAVMLDSSGKTVDDDAISMLLGELRGRVEKAAQQQRQ
jgi:hypothetical protein